MSSFALTLYVLIWPAIAGAVMLTLCVSLWRDMRKAKREGTDLVRMFDGVAAASPAATQIV